MDTLQSRLGVPQIWCGRGGEVKNPLPYLQSNTGRPTHGPSLYWLTSWLMMES